MVSGSDDPRPDLPPVAAAEPRHGMTEHELEMIIGRLLQVGVLLAAVVVLAGGVALLIHHGSTAASFGHFTGEPAALSTLAGVVRGAWHLRPREIVQFGLLLLIATPVARVAFTLVAFLAQRDRFYVVVTAIVLVLLLYGLIWGRA